MNHGKSLKKLNRTPAHRRATLRNLATSLVLHGRIETTVPKAKALKRIADKLITLAKKDSLHSRRQAMGYLFEIDKSKVDIKTKRTPVHKLFTELAPRYSDRHGGYTRLLKTGARPGDKAPMAIIEFVEEQVAEKKSKKRRVVRKSAEAKTEQAPKKAAPVEETPVEAAAAAPVEEAPAEEAKEK